jgi:hypothetical protein
MIKIEAFSAGASAYITRDGTRMQVFKNMLITAEDVATLEVENGSVTYTVDETEIVTKQSAPAKVPEPVTVRPAAKIVQPAKRTAAKTPAPMSTK